MQVSPQTEAEAFVKTLVEADSFEEPQRYHDEVAVTYAGDSWIGFGDGREVIEGWEIVDIMPDPVATDGEGIRLWLQQK